MNALNETRRAQITTAVAAGRVPTHTHRRTTLATGAGVGNRRHYIVLADHRGLTPAGRAYYEHTQQEPPDRQVDLNQQPTRQGDSEYARDRQGRQMRLRTLRADGTFDYTAAGRHFYSRRQVEMVVHVPVVIEGTRKGGATYRHTSYLPVEDVGVGRIMVAAGLTAAQKAARVRTLVLRQLSLSTRGGRTVLLEVSDETYYYDRDRPWTIDEMTTEPTEGNPRVDVRLRRVLAGVSPHQDPVSPDQLLVSPDQASLQDASPGPPPLAAAAFIPHCDQVVPEAWGWHGDNLCVVRQLSKHLGKSMRALIDEFDRLLDGPWQHEGIEVEDVKRYCQEHQLPFYCIASGRLLDAWQPAEPKGKAVAFCAFQGHMYLYHSARCVSDWTPGCEATVKLRGEARGELPPLATWLLWTGTPAPGYFACEDLLAVRRQLLQSGRSPRSRSARCRSSGPSPTAASRPSTAAPGPASSGRCRPTATTSPTGSGASATPSGTAARGCPPSPSRCSRRCWWRSAEGPRQPSARPS